MLAREGEGWRLAWDDQRHPFPLLIGGADWATELTAGEGRALLNAIRDLQAQHLALVDTLMDEESIGLEFTGSVPAAIGDEPAAAGGDSGELCVFLQGNRTTWSLRFVLHPPGRQRGVEGAWSETAALPFAQACALLVEATAAHAGSP